MDLMQVKENGTQDGKQVYDYKKNFYFRSGDKVMPKGTHHLLFLIFKMYDHLTALLTTGHGKQNWYKIENQPKLFHICTLGSQCTKKRLD